MSQLVKNYTLVKTAIVNKKQVIAMYKGHWREMCPHMIGMKRGNVHGLFYQFDGTSGSGKIIAGSPDNWRCINLEDLEDAQLKSGEWHTSTEEFDQTCIDQIDIEVEEE